jgi:hypothetical protein
MDVPNEVKIEKFSVDQLKIIYGDEIPKIINSIEDLHLSSKEYFKSELNSIENDYNNFYNEITNNINITASKMIKIFKLENSLNGKEDKEKKEMILKINNEKVATIIEILATHTQILDTIKQEMNCLKKFLKLCQNFDKNTVHIFYEQEFDNIARNWLLLKLNFEKFNFTKTVSVSTLDQHFKDFIIKTCQCKNLTVTIQNPKNYFGEEGKKITLSPEEDKKRRFKKENDIKTISENQNNIIKLKMKNINEADGYFVKSTSFTKLRGLLLENVTLKNNNVLYLFPYLSKLKIKNCQSLELNIFKNMSTNLRKLYFTKNGFVNYEFKKIVQDYLLKSQSIRDNLEVLSFANNNIAKIDFNQIIPNNSLFRALKEMDFRKNKITKFIFNKTFFPSLYIVNLCDNNLNKDYFKAFNNIIFMQSGNSFLMDKDFRNEYYDKLYKNISDNNSVTTFPINYLNISYLPEKYSISYFDKLKISPTILSSLKKLTLSYNKLNCDIFFNFVSKIKDPIYLTKLNLNGNELDDTFFEIYMEKNIASIFPKLQHLSLSSNLIGDNTVNIKYKDNIEIKDKKFEKNIYKLRMMYKFIEMNKNLKKMNITKNPISEIYTIVPEEKKNADTNNKYISKEKNGKIIIDGFFSFLIKIRDDLLDNEIEKLGRESFNIKFDCRSNINKYSENYPYCDKPIIFKK